MIRFYTRDTPGAPTISYSSSIPTWWPAFSALLKTLLVTGNGSISPLGWELIAEAAGYFVVRQGRPGGAYVQFKAIGHLNRAVQVTLAETFSGISASGDMEGAGVTSGSASASTVQGFYLSFSQHSGSTSWCISGDERTFVLNWAENGNTATPGTSGSGPCGLMYVGDDLEGNVIAMGGADTTAPTSILNTYFSQFGFTALRDPATGLLAPMGTLTITTNLNPTTASSRQGTWGSPIPSVSLAPIFWAGNAVVGGGLRGVRLAAEVSGFTHVAAASALGFVGTYNSRTAFNTIPLGDSYNYALAYTNGAAPSLMMTDNPAYW